MFLPNGDRAGLFLGVDLQSSRETKLKVSAKLGVVRSIYKSKDSSAIAYTLIETAKLKNVDPQEWLTLVLVQIADHKITWLDELLPWHYAALAAQPGSMHRKRAR